MTIPLVTVSVISAQLQYIKLNELCCNVPDQPNASELSGAKGTCHDGNACNLPASTAATSLCISTATTKQSMLSKVLGEFLILSSHWSIPSHGGQLKNTVEILVIK